MRAIKRLKNLFPWQVALGISLLALSAIIYEVHYLIFHDLKHIFIYLIGDIAFLFIQVFLVTMILDRVLALREKQALLLKMNMLIGAFFSDLGNELLRSFVSFDETKGEAAQKLLVTSQWTKKDFLSARRHLRVYEPRMTLTKGDLETVRSLLSEKRSGLLGLLANPNILEHQSFTDLLWSVSHLMEELSYRRDLARLSQADLQHLTVDLRRAYKNLVLEWINYLDHLHVAYPYLFSLAIRLNPFDATASVEIR